jgi:hypothetical protein
MRDPTSERPIRGESAGIHKRYAGARKLEQYAQARVAQKMTG